MKQMLKNWLTSRKMFLNDSKKRSFRISIWFVFLIFLSHFSVAQDSDPEQVNDKQQIWYQQQKWVRAAENGDIKRIRTLLEQGLNIERKNNSGRTALGHAVNEDNKEVVQALIEAGTDVRGKFLLLEAKSERVARHLLKAGAYLHVHGGHRGETPLMHVEDIGHLNVLLKAGVPVRATDQDGKTALMHASNVEIARRLIEAGALVNKQDQSGHTPIIYALKMDDSQMRFRMVRMLLNAGANTFIEDEEVYDYALKTNDTKLIKLIESRRKKQKQRYLNQEFQKKNKKKVRKLINDMIEEDGSIQWEPYKKLRIMGDRAMHLLKQYRNHDDENLRERVWKIIHSRLAKQFPPDWFRAAENGNLAKMKRIRAGWKDCINSTDFNRQTALHISSGEGHKRIVRYLLQEGAELSNRDSTSHTPLAMAVKGGHLQLAKKFIGEGAEVQATNSRGDTMLMMVLELLRSLSNKGMDNPPDRFTKTVRFLLKKGVRVQKRNIYRTTPLHKAAKSGFEGIVKILLKAGAKVNVKDEHNSTPLIEAARTGSQRSVQLLIMAGAKLGIRTDAKQQTALFYAVKYDHPGVVKELLEAGANPFATNRFDKSPYGLASENNVSKIAIVMNNHLIEQFIKRDFKPLKKEKEKRVRNIIRNLGADSLSERRKATKILLSKGKQVMYYLKQYRNSKDLAIRYRVEYLLKKTAMKHIRKKHKRK